jgi:FkbM family methyltransferase
MKIFLDVGAHNGETVDAVRDPKYGFDRIYCFEPARASWPALEAVRDERVSVCRFGLWNRTMDHALYDGGSAGASLFADKFKTPRPEETAQFVRASDWFREHLHDTDEVYLKLNCEGAECDIVEDLLLSGQFARVRSAMIDPDVRKISSLAFREREMQERLAASGLRNYFMQEHVMVGPSHRARIQNWLRIAGAEQVSWRARTRQLGYLLSEAIRGRRAPLRDALTRRAEGALQPTEPATSQ